MSVNKRDARLATLGAALTLMVLSAFLPEVCSGNTSITTFLTPTAFLFLVVLGYGLPVLLIRELAVRTKLTTAGILVVGFAYGSYNEGLWAKTMIDVHHVPMPTYSDYGVVLGIGIPWALTISLYHALASVLFPILATHALFPAERAKPWIDARLASAVALLLLGLSSFAFLHNALKPGGGPVQLAIFLGVIVAGTFIAPLLRRRPDAYRLAPPAGVPPVLLGASVLLPFVALSLIAAAKAPVVLFVLAWVIVVCAYTWIVTNRGWQAPPNLLLFGLGFYMQSVLLALFVRGAFGQAPLSTLVAGVSLLGIFVWAVVRINRAGGARPSTAPADA